jgi:hypothetical protein
MIDLSLELSVAEIDPELDAMPELHRDLSILDSSSYRCRMRGPSFFKSEIVINPGSLKVISASTSASPAVFSQPILLLQRGNIFKRQRPDEIRGRYLTGSRKIGMGGAR